MEIFFACMMIVGLWVMLRPKSQSVSQKKNNSRSSYQAKYRKLLSMVGGNKATCDRLIARYGIDKAIYDLERDRDIR
jgi:hypothetical protein